MNGSTLWTVLDLRLAGSNTGDGAPGACVAELRRWLDVVRENHREEDTRTGASARTIEPVTVSGHHLVVLRSDTERLVPGGFILEGESKLDLLEASHVFGAVAPVVEEHDVDALGFITA